jgi:GTP-binding protein LepA
MNNIRNFSIIAHIDHGKSTLADRFLELTGTIEERKMQDQVLDSMELERERGITIKMTPVRMSYKLDGIDYILNLIDTPGHIDFAYEVSRALKAVEGSILLVDATAGVQAQTLSTLNMAKEAGLVIIPVISKIDSPLARVDEIREEIVSLLGVRREEIILVSGKTGEGVHNLLRAIVERVPPPSPILPENSGFRSLVFDFGYSNHKGVIVFIRVFDGKVKAGDSLSFIASQESFTAIEVGTFSPEERPTDCLSVGEIGYIVTGIKKPGVVSVGDTICLTKQKLDSLPGYMSPPPVVWASLYPESDKIGRGGDDFHLLKQALMRLKLSDSSLTFEEESSSVAGRGFRCGFLGMLHLEIITERLKREFGLKLVITSPSIKYEVIKKNGEKIFAYSPSAFPPYGEIKAVYEPWIDINIIFPSEYLGAISKLLYSHEGVVKIVDDFGHGRNVLKGSMPLRELMRNFFDELKSVSSGFASLSYAGNRYEEADVVKLDIRITEEEIPALARIVSRKRVEEEAEKAVEKLEAILPRQLFVVKIQAVAMGRIIASRSISAMKKDVTGYLYGGDITRKRKLWEKQKEGKKRLQTRAKMNIPQDVFVKMMRPD